jgi:hypothetical protein
MMNSAVHRADRDALTEVTNQYLREEISAFVFDEKLSEIEARTNDETVKWVRAQLWGFYDDCDDHKVVCDKAEWDAIQRLLLLLKSDATVVVERGQPKWTVRQAIAAAGLVVAGWTVWATGWGSHLLIFNIPLGVVSMGLSYWRGRAESTSDPHGGAVAPFGSAAQLRSTRRAVHEFDKRRYPGRLARRRIRSPLVDRAAGGQTFAVARKGNPPHPQRTAVQLCDLALSCRLPHFGVTRSTAGGDESAVRRDGNVHQFVYGQGETGLGAIHQVNELRQPSPRGLDEPPFVQRQVTRRSGVGRRRPRPRLLAGGQIPFVEGSTAAIRAAASRRSSS